MSHGIRWECVSKHLVLNYLSRIDLLWWNMPVYVMLTTLTDEGRKTMKERPERIREVNEEVKKMGVEILSQYALLGPYDFLNILEAPDNETIIKVAVELGARGTVQTTTFPAISVDTLVKRLKG